MLDSFKSLELHIKDFKHLYNVKELIKTIPEEMREKKGQEKVEESMYWFDNYYPTYILVSHSLISCWYFSR